MIRDCFNLGSVNDLFGSINPTLEIELNEDGIEIDGSCMEDFYLWGKLNVPAY